MFEQNNQKGFAAFEAVLIVLLLAAIGGMGYFAYQARSNTNNDYSVVVPKKTPTSSSAKSVSKTTPSTASQDPASFVQGFYNDYINGAKSQSASAVSVAQKYGTSAFVSYVGAAKDSDPIICGQQGVSQASITTSGSGNAITAHVSYPGGDPASYDVSVGLVNTKGKLAINSITCPTQ